jgi:cell division protein FtsQ
MMTIDPRLADRRREVAEDRARHSVRRVLRLLIGIALIGAVVWLFLSPTLSVADIEVDGAHESPVDQVLAEHQIVEGRPLILIRTGDVVADLETDPWVREAEMTLDWPDRVVVVVRERTPAAWVETAGGWARRAIDGVALPGPSEPDETMGRVRLTDVADSEAEVSQLVLGSIEFVDTLPAAIAGATVVEWREGELWATVSGFEVRLGRPTEMSDKALSLAALLAEDLVPGSQINMIAPTNPAVIEPAPPESDGNGEEDDEGASGSGDEG